MSSRALRPSKLLHLSAAKQATPSTVCVADRPARLGARKYLVANGQVRSPTHRRRSRRGDNFRARRLDVASREMRERFHRGEIAALDYAASCSARASLEGLAVHGVPSVGCTCKTKLFLFNTSRRVIHGQARCCARWDASRPGRSRAGGPRAIPRPRLAEYPLKWYRKEPARDETTTSCELAATRVAARSASLAQSAAITRPIAENRRRVFDRARARSQAGVLRARRAS